MKLNIKEITVKKLEVGASGTEFEVRDTKDKHLGDFHVTKANLVWCKGKTKKENGVKMTWKKFMDIMEEK